MNRVILIALATVVAPFSAFAVDGVVLINQSTVLAAGGFPYVISQPGSYKLTGNLVAPSPLHGIDITVPNVTIDLNGFSITTPFPQAPNSPSRGIFFAGSVLPSEITIRNGTIEGFLVPVSFTVNVPGLGFVSCRYCTFEDLVLRSAFGGSVGVGFGSFVRMHHVTAPDLDLFVFCPSVISNSASRSVNITTPFPGTGDSNAGNCAFDQNATQF